MPGSIIAATWFTVGTIEFAITAFAINMVASSIISKAFSPDSNLNTTGGDTANPGSRAQVAPAGSNKLPVVYGSAYMGGTVVDLSISSDNQTLYYVIALSEVTGGSSPDLITFGDVYWNGNKVVFSTTPGELYKVTGLLDESTGITDTTVAGKMEFYFYSNGSYNPSNSTVSAISLMQDPTLVYKWDNNKLMTNCAFVILKLTYSQTANITGLQQTKFQITNARSSPGDCFYDYLTSTRYGAAIPQANIDVTSLDALDAYSSQSVSYTLYSGGTSTITRFRFDGSLDTSQPVMTNMQYMATCCDCLLKYNEITGLWGVIVQQPTTPSVMLLDDSNIIGPISVTPLDIASSFNIAEVKFPDSTAQDGFNTSTYDLSEINPALMYPNEPVNKQSISLPLVNNNVRAQILANRFLESCREDLQVTCTVSYVGLQLEAGDIITLTNANYGWVAKPFRLSKVVENFSESGSITVALTMMEYNATVYDDANVTQFTPAPNTGFGNPMAWGNLLAPTIGNIQATTTNPSFDVTVKIAPNGITQYAEVWYSAYASPSSSQLIFAGTTAVNPSGSPYAPGSTTTVTLTNIASGDWYFFTRMVNSIGSSVYSPASTIFRWRPSTFQFVERYLVVAYATNETGTTGFSSSPTNATYYGLYNSTTSGFSSNPADYTWYLASPAFLNDNFLLFSNRTGRKFSFATGNAALVGTYVPSQTSIFDPSIWSALPSGTNFIDLDARTGQLIETGKTGAVGAGELAVGNNPDGTLTAQLKQFLDFGGAQTLTGSAATITIDIYGRVLGFVSPDGFYYTRYDAVATAGQTVFTPTARQANYITGMDLVFQNGMLLDTSEYTETSTTVTLGTGAAAGDVIVILSMRAINQGITFTSLYVTVASVATNVVTYTSLPYQNIVAGDTHTFLNTGTPTQYTVQSYNAATKQITYTATVTGVSAGQTIYLYKTNGQSYRPFSRWTATLSSVSTYTPTTWAFESGYEKLFLNGASFNDQDYDIVGTALTNFPAIATGNLTIIQFTENNTTTAIGNPQSTAVNTVVGQSTYNFALNSNAFELYNNGALQILTSDYTVGSGSYTLTTTPTTTLNILQQTTYERIGAA